MKEDIKEDGTTLPRKRLRRNTVGTSPSTDSNGKKRKETVDRKEISEVSETAEVAKRMVIVSLSREFHGEGWMTGTGGAISIKTDQGFLVTPSGVLKENQKPEDIFLLDCNWSVKKSPPSYRNLTISSCQPNFQHIYRLREAGAIFHLHSIGAVMVSLLSPGKYFSCRHLQMIKGMRGHGWEDELRIPIVENQATEDGIADVLEVAVRENPKVDAVLIRRHGLYVWGKTWTQAKIQAESLDWIFKVSVEMFRSGLDPTLPAHTHSV